MALLTLQTNDELKMSYEKYPAIRQKGELSFEVVEDWKTEFGVVKKGFETNLGSVPRIFWWLMNPAADTAAFTLHDWLYVKQITTREQADLVLYKLLEANDNVSNIVAYIAFVAVRIGGRCYWKACVK